MNHFKELDAEEIYDSEEYEEPDTAREDALSVAEGRGF